MTIFLYIDTHLSKFISSIACIAYIYIYTLEQDLTLYYLFAFCYYCHFTVTATLDNLETKLTIPDDNDSVSINTTSESKKIESSTDSTNGGKIEFVGQNGAYTYLYIYIFAIGA